jgi:hypothetical protein
MRRLTALLLALASGQAFAQEVRGPYVGLGYDQINYSNTVHRLDFDETLTSPKLVAGFRFRETYSFEGSYSQSDMVSDLSGNVVPGFTSRIGPISGPTTARLEGNVDILQARVISYQGHVLLGAGFFAVDSDLTVTGTSNYGPFAGTTQERESGLSIFLGLQWDVGSWGIRGEYSYFDMDGEVDISTFGAGFLYLF